MSAGTDDDGYANGPPYDAANIPDRVREDILDGKPADEILYLEKRFWTKTRDPPGNDCIEWTAATLQDGEYGAFQLDGTRRAHRLVYEWHVGEVADDEQVNHHCDNRVCLAPGHLYAGTQAENLMDAVRRERFDGFLDGETVIEIREQYDERDVTQVELADEYGVSQSVISRIVRGESYDCF